MIDCTHILKHSPNHSPRMFIVADRNGAITSINPHSTIKSKPDFYTVNGKFSGVLDGVPSTLLMITIEPGSMVFCIPKLSDKDHRKLPSVWFPVLNWNTVFEVLQKGMATLDKAITSVDRPGSTFDRKSLGRTPIVFSASDVFIGSFVETFPSEGRALMKKQEIPSKLNQRKGLPCRPSA